MNKSILVCSFFLIICSVKGQDATNGMDDLIYEVIQKVPALNGTNKYILRPKSFGQKDFHPSEVNFQNLLANGSLSFYSGPYQKRWIRSRDSIKGQTSSTKEKINSQLILWENKFLPRSLSSLFSEEDRLKLIRDFESSRFRWNQKKLNGRPLGRSKDKRSSLVLSKPLFNLAFDRAVVLQKTSGAMTILVFQKSASTGWEFYGSNAWVIFD